MGITESYTFFETAAVSAVKRTSRGVAALVISDATVGGVQSVVSSLSEVDESRFTKDNYRADAGEGHRLH